MESTNRPGGSRGALGPASPGPSRRKVLGLGSVVLASLAGCTKATSPDDFPPEVSSSTTIRPDLEFRFGTPAMPGTLDPAIAIDNESFRVTRQVFESLVSVDPDTGAPMPGLATRWKVSSDGLTYTFTLRDDVTFHDGTEFNANAVVYNFRRWANLPSAIGGRPGQAFESVFHHHEVHPADESGVPPDTKSATESKAAKSEGTAADRDDVSPGANKPDAAHPSVETVSSSYYETCRAADSRTFVLTLRKPITGLIDALTLPGFGIASPSALRKYKADEATRDSAGRLISGFGQHPVGTGPYVFKEADDETLALVANTDHWQHQAQIGKVTFRVLREPSSRLRSLRRRRIDGYDMVTVDELRELVREGQQILQRDPFSVMYLGINHSNTFFKQDNVRKAVAHAIDRQALVKEFFVSGTKEARSFVPPSLGVPDAETYFGFDQSKARSFLQQSDYDGEPIPFTYPLNVTRAYLPLPERIYAKLSSQLTAVGFNIKPYPIDWEDGYLDNVVNGRRPGLHLLGWNGGYRDPDNFIGTLFGTTSAEFGYNSPGLRAKIVAARSMPNGDDRAKAYQAVGEQLATDLPALPLAYPISAVAANDKVLRYPTSPTLDEGFDRVTLAT